MSSTFYLALMIGMVGLSAGLPAVLDRALVALADTELDLKAFYKALETHDFTKAGKLYDEMSKNRKTLETASHTLAKVQVKDNIVTHRFIRLAEVQLKILIEKLGSIINNDEESFGHNETHPAKPDVAPPPGPPPAPAPAPAPAPPPPPPPTNKPKKHHKPKKETDTEEA